MSLAGVFDSPYNDSIPWICQMAQQKWQVEKVHDYKHVGQAIALEVPVVYPAEHLPDQPPHVIAHRCSKA